VPAAAAVTAYQQRIAFAAQMWRCSSSSSSSKMSSMAAGCTVQMLLL
jgi:hypothetical protein